MIGAWTLTMLHRRTLQMLALAAFAAGCDTDTRETAPNASETRTLEVAPKYRNELAVNPAVESTETEGTLTIR